MGEICPWSTKTAVEDLCAHVSMCVMCVCLRTECGHVYDVGVCVCVK